MDPQPALSPQVLSRSEILLRRTLPLALLSLLLLLSTGFLTYRNMQLKKQVEALQKTLTSPNPPTSPIPNANWKTYQDNDHLIEFMYPSTFRGSDVMVQENSRYISVSSGLDSGHLEIVSEKTTKPMNRWWLEIKNNEVRSKFASFKKTIFVGLDSIEVTFDKATEFGEEKFILVNANGKNFSILAFYAGSDCADYSDCWEKDLENQILSTFKFLNPQPTTNPQCGGIAGLACPTGYTCKLDGSYPDADGRCIRE